MTYQLRAVGTIAFLGCGIGIGCGEGLESGAPAGLQEATPMSEEAYAAAPTRPPTRPPAANSVTAEMLVETLPADTPDYFRETYFSLMKAPLPAFIYDLGGVPPFVPQLEIDRNPAGELGSFQPAGTTTTATNAFFLPLGTNGRACVTCHQPPSGMSVSLRNIKKRFAATGGMDPIFAPVDGANCPNQVGHSTTSAALYGGYHGKGKKAFKQSHSLLLEKGLIRVALPVPSTAEFTLHVVSDPTTCNLDPVFNSNESGARIVSVFRRPTISSNLNFKTNVLSFGPPPAGPTITNIMFDGREPTLFTQAVSATLGHAQATKAPTQAQLDQIVAFETGIFSAQLYDKKAGYLDAWGATGGPIQLSTHGTSGPGFGGAVFDEFDGWAAVTGPGKSARRAIARGQALFHGTGGPSGDRGRFAINSVAGFNDFPGIGNPVLAGACSTCHNFKHAGSDLLARAQRDIGVGGQNFAIGGPPLETDVPIFELTCPAGSFLWDPNLTTVRTNDPGKALITGKCRDIGGKTIPSLRALASHEPFFSDGSAATLLDVVNVYEKRFNIGLTVQEKRDLVAFLEAL